MTITPTSTLKTLVLAVVMAVPAAASAQVSRTTTQPPRQTTPAARPAPAPAPEPAPRQTTAPAPAPTSAPAPVGTAGTTPPAPAATTIPAGIRPWNEQDYRLGPGDKLRVELYGEPQVSQTLQVRPDGKITLSLVGDVLAAGRTPLELRDSLTSAFKAYFNNPAVSVIVQDAVANQIIVSGEVATPGPQVLLGPVTIIDAIAKAGGTKEFAKEKSIYVLRKAGNSVQRLDAAYKDAMAGKVLPMVLQPGDTVVVP
ncbi:MAG TPA: polysaccharide biosynthesis/export family protein [Vicinamibacterales bacterium]|jgi:polysaccharide export outer membrane protein|nr:polysaccharide biosynthesis/export family protein [Vicinamibacterales bacterium]